MQWSMRRCSWDLEVARLPSNSRGIFQTYWEAPRVSDRKRYDRINKYLIRQQAKDFGFFFVFVLLMTQVYFPKSSMVEEAISPRST